MTNKKLLKSLLITSICCITISCSNPKSDAKKVCECLKKIDWQAIPADDNYQKYFALNAEMLIKYAKEPTKQLEYQRELDDCTDKVTQNLKSKIQN
jgi:hypothetical protein